MRRFHKILIDFGFVPREFLSKEFTRPTQLQIGPRPTPYIDCNITWIDDPAFPRGLRTLAQINYRASDEWKVLRLCTKWGWKIKEHVREDLSQRGHEETDNTNTGKMHSWEEVDELIQKWDMNWR